MRIAIAALLTLAAASAASLSAVSTAEAQATCRAKCIEEEQACLARTGNKGQCGSRAQACTAKCK